MEQLKFPKPYKSPPFRATHLWNEAVSILERGMPTRRHFYRMRYYDNCFSGKEAVEWLSRTLTDNPRFGKNVTVEGTRKLLQHFLKTGVFHSVKGSLTFKESGLYEFVDRTIKSPTRKQDRKNPFQPAGLQEINMNIQPKVGNYPMHQVGNRIPCQYQPGVSTLKSPKNFQNLQATSKEIPWKDFILRRVHMLAPSLSVELLLDPDTVDSDWVKFNVCPEFYAIRKKTELPFWVYTAITSVIQPQDKEEYTTYAGFEKDVYAVVRDYLRHRSSPMVPYDLYELFMYTFNHFHFSDLEMKNRCRERTSAENLVLSMSEEWEEERLVCTEQLSGAVLPPNSCFETAFTSDEPITRIVPQSSVDTLCLASRKALYDTRHSAGALSTIDRSFKPKICVERMETKPLSKFKNRKKGGLRRTQSMAQLDVDAGPKRNTLPRPRPAAQSYVNFGLSQSLDDLLLEEDVGQADLNFEEAMLSVNCLLKASRPPSPAPSLSSSLDSLSTVSSSRVDKTGLVCIDSCLWFEDIQQTACQVFQCVLMLLNPVARTSLRMLLQFIDRLPVPPHSRITKTEMVYDLSAHILSPGPRSKNVYSHHLVLSVVYFLVDNCELIFQQLPDSEVNKNREDLAKENNVVKVYCEQLTKNQFEDQGLTSSWLALAELLDQIINDKKMKSKEKKKRLKKFKEAYPHIYKQRFGASPSNQTNTVHFR